MKRTYYMVVIHATCSIQSITWMRKVELYSVLKTLKQHLFLSFQSGHSNSIHAFTKQHIVGEASRYFISLEWQFCSLWWTLNAFTTYLVEVNSMAWNDLLCKNTQTFEWEWLLTILQQGLTYPTSSTPSLDSQSLFLWFSDWDEPTK